MFLFFTPKIKSILSWECFFIRCRNVEMASVKKRATPKNEKRKRLLKRNVHRTFERKRISPTSAFLFLSSQNFLFPFHFPSNSFSSYNEATLYIFCNRISLSFLHSFQNFVLFSYSIGPKSKFLKSFEEKFFGRNLFLHIRFETQPAILSFGWK